MLCNVKNGQCVLKPKSKSSRSSCSSMSFDCLPKKKCRKLSKKCKKLAKCRKLSKKCRKSSNCDTGSVIYVKEVKCAKTKSRKLSRRRPIRRRLSQSTKRR